MARALKCPVPSWLKTPAPTIISVDGHIFSGRVGNCWLLREGVWRFEFYCVVNGKETCGQIDTNKSKVLVLHKKN